MYAGMCSSRFLRGMSILYISLSLSLTHTHLIVCAVSSALLRILAILRCPSSDSRVADTPSSSPACVCVCVCVWHLLELIHRICVAVLLKRS